MRTPIALALTLITTALLCGPARAEYRKWTDTTGRVIDAELVSSNDTMVSLKLVNGQIANVPKQRLSAQDLAYVASAKPAPAASPTATAASTSGSGKSPAYFETVINKKEWKQQEPPEPFGITGYDFDVQWHTPHGIITGSQKVKSGSVETYAENLERLFAHIQADFSGAAPASPDSKWLVLITGNKEEHAKVGRAVSAVGLVSDEWDTSTATWLNLSDETQASHKLHQSVRIFRADEDAFNQSPSRNPERIHFLASSIMESFLPNYRQDNYRMAFFKLIYSYHLEHLISGKIQSKVRFSGQIGTVEGFENGKDWPGVARRLMLKSPVRPSIDKFTTLESADAEPIDLAFGFCLVRMIFSDPVYKNRLADQIALCINEKRPLIPQDYATILGCNGVNEVDELWLNSIKK